MTETAMFGTAMFETASFEAARHRPTLVLGGAGRTGRRLGEWLTRRDPDPAEPR